MSLKIEKLKLSYLNGNIDLDELVEQLTEQQKTESEVDYQKMFSNCKQPEGEVDHVKDFHTWRLPNEKPHPELLEKEKEQQCLNMQYYMEYCQRNGYVTPDEWLKNYKQ